MHILGTQYNKHSGPDAVHQHKIELTVDESQQDGLYDFLKTVKKGSSLLVVFLNVDDENGDVEDISNETPKQTKKRFQKRMHALINQKAIEHGKEPEEIKNIVKNYLTQKGYMEKSSSELSVKGYAAAIYYLQSEF